MLDVVPCSSDVFASGMELFSELLSSHRGFLAPEHINALLGFCKTSLATEHYNRLIQGDDSVECVQFGHFLLTLGDSRLDALISEVHDVHSHHLIEQLCGLLTARGHPVVDDRIFVPAVEFWSTVIETIADHVSSDDTGSNQSIHALRQFARTAVHSACVRIMFPPPNTFSEWDSADREGFLDARKDVADLLQAMHAISGRDLVTRFVDLVLQALANTLWIELEAASFCLGALAECVTKDPAYDDLLAAVFSPAFFNTAQSGEASVPIWTRQSCIALIEKYADYFERNTSSLPNALNLLFSVMDDSLLGGPASKSIHRLCRSCRPALVSEVDTFVAEYRSIAIQREVDCLANERVVGAIGAVIQAIGDEGTRVAALHQLLDVLFGDAEACLVALRNGTPGTAVDSPRLYRCGARCLADVPLDEIPQHASIRVLRCLVAIGKGLQAPAEVPVDVDSEGHERPGIGGSAHYESVHTRIISVMTQLQAAFPAAGEGVEAICSVFRTGFTESGPGPFVFPPAVVGNYLTQQTLSTPRIGALVSAACSFVSSKPPQIPRWHSIMTGLINWTTGLLHALPGKTTHCGFFRTY